MRANAGRGQGARTELAVLQKRLRKHPDSGGGRGGREGHKDLAYSQKTPRPLLVPVSSLLREGKVADPAPSHALKSRLRRRGPKGGQHRPASARPGLGPGGAPRAVG